MKTAAWEVLPSLGDGPEVSALVGLPSAITGCSGDSKAMRPEPCPPPLHVISRPLPPLFPSTLASLWRVRSQRGTGISTESSAFGTGSSCSSFSTALQRNHRNLQTASSLLLDGFHGPWWSAVHPVSCQHERFAQSPVQVTACPAEPLTLGVPTQGPGGGVRPLL